MYEILVFDNINNNNPEIEEQKENIPNSVESSTDKLNMSYRAPEYDYFFPSLNNTY